MPFRAPTLVALAVTALAGCGGERAPREELEPAPEYGIDPATIEARPPLIERLLVLALDGATWDILDPVLEAGERAVGGAEGDPLS